MSSLLLNYYDAVFWGFALSFIVYVWVFLAWELSELLSPPGPVFRLLSQGKDG